ncbi:MAG: DUF1302 domain-containing protein [Puniceicoccaceae bacterium]
MTTPVKSGSFWTLLLAFLSAAPVALGLDFSNGDLSGNLDVTISVGGSYRLDDPSLDLIGLANGGTAYSVNSDDGNLNYKKGWYSAPVLLSADLEFRYKNSGAFFRANAFYDYINEEKDRERTPLTPDALDRVGSRFDMLDAYFWTNLEMGSMPLNFRIGRQVLNWGESTFIQNGINAINPVDVSKLRLPGSELRDALLPVWMVSGSLAVTENVTLEAFYQLKWKEIIIDPPGTYFSTNDFVGRGGERVYLGFGALSDLTPLGAIPRGPNSKPSDSGQFGIAARIYAPELGGTEFGIFFLNTHSRLPVLSAMTPTVPINTDLTGPLTAVFVQAGLPAQQAAAQATQLWGLLTIAQKFQINPALLTPTELAILQDPVTQATLASPQTTAAVDGASRIALLQSAATGRYLVEYPEDIQLVGFSFNTDVGTTGISLQGEISYKWDQPLQIDDVELLFAALSAVNPGFGQVNQIGDFLGQLGTYVKGWQEEEVWQAQATATKVFGPMMGADQAVFLIEGGMTYVPGLPSKGDLRFDAPGTFVGGNPVAEDAGLQPATEPASAFADSTSWGYRAVAKLDYLNAFMSTNLSPIIQFAHDVSGTTPSPIVNFVEGRKSLTLALQATYQNSWAANISYTNYFGAGRYNLIHDRDFVSVTVKYSF